MKKQSLIKKLHKPVHPSLGNVVLLSAIILIVAGIFVLLLEQSSEQLPISQNILSPTPTSILTQSPNVTQTLLPTDTWKTYYNYTYHFSVMLPPEIVPITTGDGQFNPYVRNAFIFREQGTNGLGFHIAYNPAPSGTPAAYNQCVDMDTCYQLSASFYEPAKKFPLYSTVLGKRVKGVGWYAEYPSNGGQKKRIYSYDYLIPVRTKGESMDIEFTFAELQPQQILAKQPLVDTIVSTVKLDN